MKNTLFALLVAPALLAGCESAPKGAATPPASTSTSQKTDGM